MLISEIYRTRELADMKPLGEAKQLADQAIDIDALAKAIVNAGKTIVEEYNSINYFDVNMLNSDNTMVCTGFTFLMYAGSNVPIFSAVRKEAKAAGVQPAWKTQKMTDPQDHEYEFRFNIEQSAEFGKKLKSLVKKCAGSAFDVK